MFTSKGLFSKIDCPYSDRCLLPKCLFAHHKPPAMKPAENMPAVPSPKLPSEKQAIAVAAEDGQRKRRKIGHGDVVETKSSTAKTEVKLAVKESSSKSSEKRPISPPPPRRTSSLAPGKKPEEMSKTEPKVPVTTKPALKAAPSVPKPTKSEALNPRLLKHSPATHDLRTKLVKLLHDQLVRLNTELAKESPSEKPLILTTQELITMALDIEEQAAKDKPAIHSSIVKNTIVRYKKMPLADWKSARQTSIDAQAAASALTPSTKPPLTALAPKPLATGLPPTSSSPSSSNSSPPSPPSPHTATSTPSPPQTPSPRPNPGLPPLKAGKSAIDVSPVSKSSRAGESQTVSSPRGVRVRITGENLSFPRARRRMLRGRSARRGIGVVGRLLGIQPVAPKQRHTSLRSLKLSASLRCLISSPHPRTTSRMTMNRFASMAKWDTQSTASNSSA
ncbi:hypothetical protein GMDG_06535 [Pseudogymnoascus destructans 20631-21]|uniref:Uncharacterized protein n=1 Tax=Pseudogymnoascus destructans (strain ATCC MYA-4855 / 20631-21) TaxID=658429 RepID=L8FSS0_PSED2|nr:hypothetical protein GMDG_06535 [Pseudogymnoascus destructans 20631-21]